MISEGNMAGIGNGRIYVELYSWDVQNEWLSALRLQRVLPRI